MADEPSRVPNRLWENFERWQRQGRPGQPAIRWNSQTWRETLPGYVELFAALPDRIDREVVSSYGDGAAQDGPSAAQAFIAAMVWGYGRVGYGAFRTARVLEENPHAVADLQEAARRVRDDGGAAAFTWLAGNRLRFLGVAFATKYLYFCGGRSPQPALILDRLVQRWLRRHADCFVRLDWRHEDYRRYLDLATDWAGCLHIAPDQVEYLMFADTVSEEPGSQWSIAPSAPAVTGDEMRPVLDALDEAASAGAALPGMTAADLDDFERAIRQARRVLLSRDRSVSHSTADGGE